MHAAYISCFFAWPIRRHTYNLSSLCIQLHLRSPHIWCSLKIKSLFHRAQLDTGECQGGGSLVRIGAAAISATPRDGEEREECMATSATLGRGGRDAEVPFVGSWGDEDRVGRGTDPARSCVVWAAVPQYNPTVQKHPEMVYYNMLSSAVDWGTTLTPLSHSGQQLL